MKLAYLAVCSRMLLRFRFQLWVLPVVLLFGVYAKKEVLGACFVVRQVQYTRNGSGNHSTVSRCETTAATQHRLKRDEVRMHSKQHNCDEWNALYTTLQEEQSRKVTRSPRCVRGGA